MKSIIFKDNSATFKDSLSSESHEQGATEAYVILRTPLKEGITFSVRYWT